MEKPSQGGKNVTRYYIGPVLSGGFRHSQTGPESKAGGHNRLYHFSFCGGQLDWLCGSGHISGIYDKTVKGALSLYGKGNEGHCVYFDDYGGI